MRFFAKAWVGALCASALVGCVHTSQQCRENGRAKITSATQELEAAENAIRSGNRMGAEAPMMNARAALQDIDAQAQPEFAEFNQRLLEAQAAMEGRPPPPRPPELMAAMAAAPSSGSPGAAAAPADGTAPTAGAASAAGAAPTAGAAAPAGAAPLAATGPVTAESQRAKLQELAGQLELALPNIKGKELSRNSLKIATDLSTSLESTLAAGKSLETEPTYAQFVAVVREFHTKAAAEITLAKNISVFIRSAGVLAKNARYLLEISKSESRSKKNAAVARARDEFMACHEAAEKMVQEFEGLGKAKMYLAGKETSPGAVVKECGSQVKALERRVGRAPKGRSDT
jgi:hypothetical protein